MNSAEKEDNPEKSASNPATENDRKPEEQSKKGKGKKDYGPPLSAKEEMGEFAKTALLAVVLALLIRTFMYEPFNIPSGSMLPTLDIGDYLFVNKPSYGYSQYSFPFGLAPISGRVFSDEPKRGDVVVFWNANTRQNYIKRIVGLPGERIQVRQGRLFINNKRVEREFVKTREVEDPQRGTVAMKEYIETLPGGVIHQIYEESDSHPLDNTQVYQVPDGHYFMMGDNRDNSQDSRVLRAVGPIPFENFVGRADIIFFSTNGYAGLLEFWKWPWSLRYDRFFMSIGPIRPDKESEPEKQSPYLPVVEE